jgi:hypothetical protein
MKKLFFFLKNAPNRLLMRVFRSIYNKFNDHILLIHTPKCAGTYLHRQYGIHQKLNITPVGHVSYRSLNIEPKAKIVGLIREPTDWYASYYFFCKERLSHSPQNTANFPISHPISIFSDNANLGFEEMISNFLDVRFVQKKCEDNIIANIYKKDIGDVHIVLNLPSIEGPRLNVAARPSRILSSELLNKVKMLDGDVASIVGGYFK